MQMNKYFRYFLLVLYFIGTAARDVIARLILDYLGPLSTSAMMALLATVTCLLIDQAQIRLIKDHPRNHWNRSRVVRLFSLSVSTALAVYLGNVAIDKVGPVTYKILEVTTFPSWVAFLMFIFLHHAAPKKDLIATGIALLGFLIFYADRFDQFQVQWLGIAAALASALAYAVSLILAKGLLADNLRPASLIAGRFLLLGLLAVTVSPVELFQLPSNILWYLLGLGVIAYGVLFTFMFYLIREVPATTMAVFIAGAPIFTAVMAWLMVPGTSYSLIELGGLVVIVAGMLVAVIIEGNSPAPSPQAAD
jgi:drug/metabolite transporter (DMT)-like permease